jgi:preprotein translocase subunit YajC
MPSEFRGDFYKTLLIVFLTFVVVLCIFAVRDVRRQMDRMRTQLDRLIPQRE